MFFFIFVQHESIFTKNTTYTMNVLDLYFLSMY